MIEYISHKETKQIIVHFGTNFTMTSTSLIGMKSTSTASVLGYPELQHRPVSELKLNLVSVG